LITFPVVPERLDVYSQFLLPAKCSLRRHKVIETTEILLHMVAAGRGVAALLDWMVDQYADTLSLVVLRFGRDGIAKQRV